MKTRAITYVGLTVGAVLLAAGSAAMAFGPGPMGGGGPGCRGKAGMSWLMRADADKDGAITQAEIEALRGQRFARFDRDKDGVVTQAEVEQAVQERVDRMTKRIVRRFDQDRDGKITEAEFNRFAKERFTWLDLNDDGKVTKDEMPRFGRHKMRW